LVRSGFKVRVSGLQRSPQTRTSEKLCHTPYFKYRFYINHRCPKPQIVQSVECSTVGKDMSPLPRGCNSVQLSRAWMGMGYYGPLLHTFEHSTDCTCCDIGHLQFDSLLKILIFFKLQRIFDVGRL
jgi:hypothetical protein